MLNLYNSVLFFLRYLDYIVYLLYAYRERAIQQQFIKLLIRVLNMNKKRY